MTNDIDLQLLTEEEWAARLSLLGIGDFVLKDVGVLVGALHDTRALLKAERERSAALRRPLLECQQLLEDIELSDFGALNEHQQGSLYMTLAEVKRALSNQPLIDGEEK